MNAVTQVIKNLKISSRRKVISELFGNYKSVFKGQGIEFEDLREYIPGDNIKDIDWNSTAKSGTVYIRKYKETRELNVLFAIDASSSMNWGINPKLLKKDIVLSIVYLLLLSSEKHGDRTGMTIFREKIIGQIAFRKGKEHTVKILKDLSSAYDESYFSKSDISILLKFLINNLKKRVVCFILTDQIDIDNNEVLKLLKTANKKHELILVNISDPFEQNMENLSSGYFEDIETGETIYIEMDQNTNRFYKELYRDYKFRLKRFALRNNIGLIDITSGDDILTKLIGYFKRINYTK